ncbi:M15 family metallopeptidase [Nocardioides sp. QY071]|uniref:M15 family metallopeptidase n=1 Tax=Nocardioides sp. QY071 TaxID=3044187 RepID=UPI00249B06AE|nr:M15 family metallopeptidase [Nocardioides sp. QY071]WGY02230.1 M15 family metallopeptidase [Nocardioides sp. QY071]
MLRSRALTLTALAALATAGCTADPVATTPAPAPEDAPVTTASPTPTPDPAPAGFTSSSRRLTDAEQAAMRGVTWHPGCPVPLTDLRVVRLAFHDFAGRRRTGRLVVHRDTVADLRQVFEQLWDLGFPIRRMRPIEAYGGDDFASIEADNTSAFNCRAKTGSSATWSHHAYGRAIDVNPLENPYVLHGRTTHDGSVPFLDRSAARPGVLREGDPVVASFDAIGWYWGGRWHDPVDHQHFSAMPD